MTPVIGAWGGWAGENSGSARTPRFFPASLSKKLVSSPSLLQRGEGVALRLGDFQGAAANRPVKPEITRNLVAQTLQEIRRIPCSTAAIADNARQLRGACSHDGLSGAWGGAMLSGLFQAGLFRQHAVGIAAGRIA